VSWVDCTDIMRRWGLSLPSEAQWEYAARGGSATPWWPGDTVKDLQGTCNINDEVAHARAPALGAYEMGLTDGHVVHAPVGLFRPNAFGLHNMIGNVSEWCRDAYARYSEAPRSGDGLRVSEAPRNRVSRGGSFSSTAQLARSSRRVSSPPEYVNANVGMRACKPITP